MDNDYTLECATIVKEKKKKREKKRMKRKEVTSLKKPQVCIYLYRISVSEPLKKTGKLTSVMLYMDTKSTQGSNKC